MSYVGIDIAKLTFVACARQEGQSTTCQFNNTPEGCINLQKWVTTHGLKSPHYCMESTGKYSFLLANYLYAQQEKISLVNPFSIKHFAKSLMLRNKTDRIDASLIAQFCQTHSPSLWSPKPANIARLGAWLKRVSQLESMQRQDKNRLELEQDKTIISSIQSLVDQLQQQIDALLQKMTQLIASDDSLSQKANLLNSIKGVGKKTMIVVLSQLGDPKQFTHAKQFTAYMGINPSHKQSGTSLDQAAISKLGSAYLRQMFYMPTLCAIVHNPLVRTFYQRLLANGKPKMVAVCAAMRKLVFIIFGVLKNGTAFDPNYTHK